MSLIELKECHLDLVLKWRNSQFVSSGMYSSRPIGQEEHREWFSRIKEDLSTKWYVHENECGMLDGVVYFTSISTGSANAFWGFYRDPALNKTGVGARMCFEALDQAFFKLGLHKLNAEVISSNAVSIKFHRKLGFIAEGIFRDFYRLDKEYKDVYRFGILRSEWLALRDSHTKK
jgi:UDP-4-amino-4,6-dideoxy-N-acetyl-beta-L-altrosamine N-acetyltransferase